MIADDRIGTLDVAHDLIELGRVAEAIALLDDELPERHSIPCAACGQPVGYKCHNEQTVACTRCNATGKVIGYDIRYSPATRSPVPCELCGGRKEREIWVDTEVPHASRVLGIARRW